MRLSALLLVIFCVPAVVLADLPRIPIDCNFEQHDAQFHIYTKAFNTPVVRARFYQGTNTWDATGWDTVLRYGKSDSDDQMVTVTGVVYGVYADFHFASNQLSKVVSKWYCAVMLTTNGEVNSQCDGYITVERSPEVNASLALPRTTAINGSAYGPFTGTFDHWPFLTTNTTASLSNQVALLEATTITQMVDSASITNVRSGSTNVSYFSAPWGDARYALSNALSAVAGSLASVSNAVDGLELRTSSWDTAYGWGDHATNGYVTASVTNGLATEAYVIASTSGIHEAGISYADGATNALYGLLDPRIGTLEGRTGAWNQAGVDATYSTNWIAGYVAPPSALTPWTSDVSAATYSLTNLGMLSFALSEQYAISNVSPFATASLNMGTNRIVYLAPGVASTDAATLGQVQAATSGLVTASITNGLASIAYVDGATNGLVTESVTNGLASTIYVIAATSGIYEAGVSYTDGATNGLDPRITALEGQTSSYLTVESDPVFVAWTSAPVFVASVDHGGFDITNAGTIYCNDLVAPTVHVGAASLYLGATHITEADYSNVSAKALSALQPTGNGGTLTNMEWYLCSNGVVKISNAAPQAVMSMSYVPSQTGWHRVEIGCEMNSQAYAAGPYGWTNRYYRGASQIGDFRSNGALSFNFWLEECVQSLQYMTNGISVTYSLMSDDIGNKGVGLRNSYILVTPTRRYP